MFTLKKHRLPEPYRHYTVPYLLRVIANNADHPHHNIVCNAFVINETQGKTMKTITKSELLNLLEKTHQDRLQAANEKYNAMIDDLLEQDFTDVEVIAPQQDGDGWRFFPIPRKENNA